MGIELPRTVEAELRAAAEKQGRAIDALIEEAVRQYLVNIAITDLDSSAIAATQIAIASDLSSVSSWDHKPA